MCKTSCGALPRRAGHATRGYNEPLPGPEQAGFPHVRANEDRLKFGGIHDHLCIGRRR